MGASVRERDVARLKGGDGNVSCEEFEARGSRWASRGTGWGGRSDFDWSGKESKRDKGDPGGRRTRAPEGVLLLACNWCKCKPG